MYCALCHEPIEINRKIIASLPQEFRICCNCFFYIEAGLKYKHCKISKKYFKMKDVTEDYLNAWKKS